MKLGSGTQQKPYKLTADPQLNSFSPLSHRNKDIAMTQPRKQQVSLSEKGLKCLSPLCVCQV